ncbi:Echinoderm microtubule-associated-like protein [Blattella germanica]|nr:Echinoderm microtubule-associated-like protein [Blattella germanica]
MPSGSWKPPLSRKSSIVEAPDAPPPGGGSKPSSGRVIRIINNQDHTVQCRVLLNLRTSQPFEEVLEDLGQVLKMNGAKRMYTVAGQEVRSFSQLRNEFADVDTFYLATSLGMGTLSSPVRRSRSRAATHNPQVAADEARDAAGTSYGYRGTDSKRNLWVLPTGEMLYFVGAVAVLYDRDEDTQRHYIGHTEDIQCMDLHPSREMVASGQRAGRNRKTQAHIRIWSTETLLTLYVFGMGEFEIGVSAVAFSQLKMELGIDTVREAIQGVLFCSQNGGSYVLAVDAGRERILSVWQWQWGHLLGKVATLQDDLTGAAFHPLDDNLLITHGKGHLTFWTRRKDGFFERTDIIKPPSRTNITTLQFEQDGDVVTADGDGFITIYSVDSDGAYFVRMEFEAHTKGISALVMLSEGTLLSGGEKDRKIIAWDTLQNYKKITETKLQESAGGVRSIYPQRPGRNDGNIYVGTTKNNIMEGSLQRRFNQVVFGHSRHLWGLAVHPDDDLFATGGHDKNIAMWRRNKLLWSVQGLYECVSLCFHPFGVVLAAGSTEGHLVVLNAENGAPVVTIRVCGSPLNCLGYNPAGDMIAIGSQNGSVYLFRVSRDGFSYKKWNKIRGSQPLTQLDWSTDGCYLQTVTADYDLVFWDIKNVVTEKSPIGMKDVKWYTHNATVGFLVAGIWNNRFYPMASLIVRQTVLFVHRYPCLSAKAEYNEEKVYSMQIATARFMYNDKNVVTVGGTDATLVLWDVIDD